MNVPQHTATLKVINTTNIWQSLPSVLGTEGPAISWNAKKGSGQEPNTAEIEIFNLNAASVASITDLVENTIEFGPREIEILRLKGISQQPSVTLSTNLGIASVELMIGYVGEPLWIWYVGQSTKIVRNRNTPQTSLKLVCADHGEAVGAGQIYPPKTYVKGSSVAGLIVDLIYAMGLSVEASSVESAFLAAAARLGKVVTSTTQLLVPYVSAGSARKQLDQLLTALKLSWMVLDGIFYLLEPDDVLPGYGPITFTPSDGTVIGTPRLIEGGAVEIDTVLRPGLIPYRAAVVKATGLGSISYRIRNISSSGHTESGASATVTMEVLQTIPGVL